MKSEVIPGQSARSEASPWAIVVVGMLSLAIAMGIGRFAFTPLLPMMLTDGVIDLPGASWLASANYLGYLVGALLCTFQPWIWRRFSRLPPVAAITWARGGLLATCVLTLGMALPLPALWPLLRFAAGVASAFVFIFGSGWVLAQLAKRDAVGIGAAMFAGPGAGIALSGLAATGMVAMHWTASSGWLIFGVIAVVLTAIVWPTLHQRSERQDEEISVVAAEAALANEVAPAIAVVPPSTSANSNEMGVLAFTYGLAGLGYIVTATFLPVIARQALPPSALLDMFWPIFGFAVFAGAMMTSRIRLKGDMRYWLAAAYFLQALAIAVSIWLPTLTGFALSSVLLGVPFTALTFFAMQEVRRLKPLSAPSYMGLLTAVYGAGQIAGPPMVAILIRHTPSVSAGFTLSLQIACAALVLGGLIYLWMVRTWPVRG